MPEDTVLFTFSGHGQNARTGAKKNTFILFDKEYDGRTRAVHNKAAEILPEIIIDEDEFSNIVKSHGINDPFVVLIADTHNGSPGWLDPTNHKHIRPAGK
jgi:hypothetical protein